LVILFILGPAGSGKTTYCHRMGEFLYKEYGPSNVKRVNLDPGNDLVPYKVDVDVSQLVSVEDVMDRMNLGPNASLIYAMQFIDENFEECILNAILKEFELCDPIQPCWVLFDMPGQVNITCHKNKLIIK
jgi:GTPase SAR1 family protein